MKLKIVEHLSPHAPNNLVGYFIERENGSRVAETFCNCGRTEADALQLATWICNAWNKKTKGTSA